MTLAGRAERPSVAATLIIRNEAAFLPDCLDSLNGRVNAIIIVDALSTDDSVAIAQAKGAQVISRVWNDDFAAARNAAIDAHDCDFSLYIDADERLVLPDGGHVGDYLLPEEPVQLVRFQPRTGFTRYLEWRIMRNIPELRFEGRIHESIVPAARRLGVVPAPTHIAIDHLGYDGAMRHKWLRNMPVLERALIDTPERGYLWLDLAECQLGLGDSAAARASADAGIAAAASHPRPEQHAAASLLWMMRWRIAEAAQDATEMDAAINGGIAHDPSDYGLLYLAARRHVDGGDAEAALAIAQQLQAIDPDNLFTGPLAFDRRIFRDGACEVEGRAWMLLGQRDAAARAFARAASLAANHAAGASAANPSPDQWALPQSHLPPSTTDH